MSDSTVHSSHWRQYIATLAGEQKQQVASVVAICALFDIVLTMAYLNALVNYRDSTCKIRILAIKPVARLDTLSTTLDTNIRSPCLRLNVQYNEM